MDDLIWVNPEHSNRATSDGFQIDKPLDEVEIGDE